MADIRYFLGGNTPAGFYSLYHELSAPEKTDRLYILKGGAGCGKSTLMKGIARLGKAAGLECEQTLCSGDPHSLDAVRFPALGVAMVDGTSPHVVEADYAGAVERYVDLSRFYRWDALRPLRDTIIAATHEYRGHYKRVYRCLEGAGQLLRDTRELLDTPALRHKLEKRAKGIISREIRPAKGGSGSVSHRFITAITHQGAIALWDTVTAQATRIYQLSDSFGLSHTLLVPILNAAQAAGHDVVACPDPLAPDRLAHLIIPELSLAFVTDCPRFPWPHHAYRRLRVDAMADEELARTARPRLRFSRKVADALIGEAVTALESAKAAHDRLEELYNPHVDFDGVRQMTEDLAEEILAMSSGS